VPFLGHSGEPLYPGSAGVAHIESMTSAYFTAIAGAFSFMVGVISSPPGS